MAIAGITVQTTAEAYVVVRERLRDAEGVAEMRETGTPCVLAAVVEAGADRIEDVLGALGGWEGVLNIGLVSISYEDELEENGRIACPEHKARNSHNEGVWGDRPKGWPRRGHDR